MSVNTDHWHRGYVPTDEELVEMRRFFRIDDEPNALQASHFGRCVAALFAKIDAQRRALNAPLWRRSLPAPGL